MMQNRPTSPAFSFLAGHSRKPDPALKLLDALVGTWNIKGREFGSDAEINGHVSFERLEGGFFFVQHVNIDHNGQRIRGIEIIAYEESTKTFTSHYFDNRGNTFEYVWEIGDGTLTIWGGYVGSQVSFKGKFSDNGNVIADIWESPGGGYTATIIRAGSR